MALPWLRPQGPCMAARGSSACAERRRVRAARRVRPRWLVALASAAAFAAVICYGGGVAPAALAAFAARAAARATTTRGRRRSAKRITRLVGKTWAADQVPLVDVDKALLKPYVAELLRRAKFFKDLTQEQLERTTSLLRVETFAKGDEVIRQGEVGDCLYIVLDGAAEAYVMSTDGEEQRVKSYEVPGEYFGELALLTNATRRATVKTVAECTTLLSLGREEFEQTLGPFRELLMRNAAFRPADQALSRVRELQALSPLEQWLGLRGGQRQLLLVVGIYLLAGTAFYTWSGFKEFERTTPLVGFYFTVETALAVGFGKLTPRSEAAPFFTAAFVIVGAALFANYLSALVADVIENAEAEVDDFRNKNGTGSFAKTALPLLVWWAIGVAFGRIHEGWEWGTAILFAVSATSSIGIQGLASDDDTSLLFCATYVLVGVPLYVLVVGRSSVLIAERIVEERQKQIRDRAVATLGDCDDDCLVDVFCMHDADQNGTITTKDIPELMKFLAASQGMVITEHDVAFFLEEFDTELSGCITSSDFIEGVRRWTSSADRR